MRCFPLWLNTPAPLLRTAHFKPDAPAVIPVAKALSWARLWTNNFLARDTCTWARLGITWGHLMCNVSAICSCESTPPTCRTRVVSSVLNQNLTSTSNTGSLRNSVQVHLLLTRLVHLRSIKHFIRKTNTLLGSSNLPLSGVTNIEKVVKIAILVLQGTMWSLRLFWPKIKPLVHTFLFVRIPHTAISQELTSKRGYCSVVSSNATVKVKAVSSVCAKKR